MMNESEETSPAFRRLFATVSNNMFSAFLVKAREDHWILSDARVDIQGAMRMLVEAYSEGRVVVLSESDVRSAKRVRAQNVFSSGTKREEE